jgi:hypothetical protein
MCKKKRKWARLGICSLFLGALALGGLLMGPQPASAQSCIEEQAHKSLVCTANDIQVAYADNVRDTSGNSLTQCTDGETFSFIADFHVTTTASTRYDIGLYFATDGDPNHNGARSGVCSANIITPLHTDPASPGIVTLGSADGVNKDGDTCLDVTTDAGWGKPNGKIVTVRVDNVMCQAGTNGFLSLPNCTSWSQNTGVACTNPALAAPGSPSKCSCDVGFTVPIFVETGSIQVTKDSSPASRPEPGGEFTFTVQVANTAQFTSLTVDKICDDKYGLIDKVASATDCPAGTLGTINSETCNLPQTLAPGASYSCEFKANVNSNTPTSVTNVVSVFGHDQNNKPVSGSDSAQVAITNVAPTATVVKSLVGLECADVNYRVRVNNTDSAESLTLTALSDSGFGSITSVHDAVLATTCSVPRDIAAGGNYECDFRAHFCGGSHTDTVTGTLNDNESGVINPQSNSLTVDVSAVLHPQP